MLPEAALALAILWLVCWLMVSYQMVQFIKLCAEEGDAFWRPIAGLEDQLPSVVMRLLFTWPACVRTCIKAIRLVHRHRNTG